MTLLAKDQTTLPTASTMHQSRLIGSHNLHTPPPFLLIGSVYPSFSSFHLKNLQKTLSLDTLTNIAQSLYPVIPFDVGWRTWTCQCTSVRALKMLASCVSVAGALHIAVVG